MTSITSRRQLKRQVDDLTKQLDFVTARLRDIVNNGEELNIEVFLGEDGHSWYWRVKDTGNHKILSIGGEPFVSKRNAANGALELFPGAKIKFEE